MASLKPPVLGEVAFKQIDDLPAKSVDSSQLLAFKT